MPLITAIEQQPRRRRYNVYVDGEFALALDPETLATARLRVGMAVTGNLLLDLAAQDRRKRVFDAALRLLAHRPRSEHELRTRLRRKGLPPDLVEDAMERLRGHGYLDDRAFAQFWVEARGRGSPRGGRLLRHELLTKGVARAIVAEAAAATDEHAAARRAARKKLPSLRGLDYPTFRNRLGGYLARRGFGYDVIAPVVRACWQAQHGAPPDEDDTPA